MQASDKEFLPTFCNIVFQYLVSVLLAVGCLACIGCGASEDPAAIQALKDKEVLLMKSPEGQIYQIALGKVPLSDEIATEVAKLGLLKNLNFKGAELTDATFTKAVSGLDPISVILSGTAITDAGIKAMAGYGRIEAIFLANTAVTDEALKTIGKLTSILELNLDGTKITNEGLKHITGMSGLKRLVVNNTSVDDTGLETLHSMTNLSKIDAENAKVTPDGIRAIKAAIPGLVVVVQ